MNELPSMEAAEHALLVALGKQNVRAGGPFILALVEKHMQDQGFTAQQTRAAMSAMLKKVG